MCSHAIIYIRYLHTPMIHLVCPTKFCLTFAFHFSWALREICNNAYAKFWGANKVYSGRSASGE